MQIDTFLLILFSQGKNNTVIILKINFKRHCFVVPVTKDNYNFFPTPLLIKSGLLFKNDF